MLPLPWYSRYVLLGLAVIACPVSFYVSISPRTWDSVWFLTLLLHAAATVLMVDLPLGSAPFWRRLLEYWLPLVLGISGWLAVVYWKYPQALEAFELALVLPAFALGTQWPLWIVRYAFRLRLVQAPATDISREVWTIRQLSVGIVLAAISLALVRVSNARLDQAPPAVLGWSLVLLAFYPLAILLPAVICILRPRQGVLTIPWLLLHPFVLAIVLCTGLIMAVQVFKANGLILLVGPLYVAMLLPGTWVGVYFLRFCGYRLIWGEEREWRA